MSSALADRPLVRLAAYGRKVSGRATLGVLVGAAALAAGVGLSATAAWLIARASQMPPVLSLGVAVTAVQFFGIARPVLRYFGRLFSHDAAFRIVAEVRTAVYRQLIPVTPGRLGSHRQGDVLAGVVSDVDAVQDLDLRIIEPAAVAAQVSAACVGVAAARLPTAAAVLAVGHLAGGGAAAAVRPAAAAGRGAGRRAAGGAAPAATAAAARRTTAALAPLRASLSAVVVDLLRGAPDLIALGSADRMLAEIDWRDAQLTRMTRRAAWATGLGAGLAALAAGASVWASAIVATPAVRDGRLAGVTLAVIVL